MPQTQQWASTKLSLGLATEPLDRAPGPTIQAAPPPGEEPQLQWIPHFPQSQAFQPTPGLLLYTSPSPGSQEHCLWPLLLATGQEEICKGEGTSGHSESTDIYLPYQKQELAGFLYNLLSCRGKEATNYKK